MKNKKPLFVLFGNGPFQNHGCEAILRSTIDILIDEFGPCRFTNSLLYWREMDFTVDLGAEVIHQVPAPEEKRKKRRQFLPSWLKKPFRRYIPYLPSWLKKPFRRQAPQHPRELFESYLPEAVAALAVGGDNYSLEYGTAKRHFQANEAVLRHKKPLILWGASVGPFSKDPEFERYASQELKKISLICARESETIDYLASIGVTENVCQVADPAFLLKPSPIDNNAPELKMIRQPCIGLNFSPLMSRYWNQDASWEDCVYECINEMLKKFDLPIILIPHVVWSYSDDHRFMQTIVERLNVSKDRLLLIGRDYNCMQLKWLISHLTLFIGCRTHATIASLSSNVPTLSIAYSMKARGINKDIFGHNDWLIALDELTPEHLSQKADMLLSAQDEIRNYLDQKMPAYKDKTRIAGRYLKNLLFQKS